MIEIRAIGGYGEVGKNCTAVKVDDEVVIFDMGLHLPHYIKYTEEEGENITKLSAKALQKVQAIPDDSLIDDWRDQVQAIIPSHAHLDHIGAIPYLARKYNQAPVICTPFTAAVLKTILKDEKIDLPNQIKVLTTNGQIKLTDKLKVEFVNITHSTPQAVAIALHTPYGVVLYATDFKIDDHPVLGKPPNYEALKRLQKQGILVSFIDTLYADSFSKTPCESTAKEMLRDVMLGVNSKGSALLVTTFSSHIARLKSIVEFGKQLKRKIVFMGRSLSKYSRAAEQVNLINFSKDVQICHYGKQVRNKLKEIQKKPEKYLMVITGHQGEPKSVLSRIANGDLPFKFKSQDHLIFSSIIIPTDINRKQRAVLEKNLIEKGVRLFKDIHVSGHGAREDLRDFVNLIKAQHLIPVHSEKPKMDAFIQLAEEMGYKKGQNVHEIFNSQSLTLSP
ncbi:RNase J family beta-CASP ribonuclease [Candidatus Woesearchaeota archaeon]|nr:RNase J family beta-CASP ribonuclease [Candidatus Woesearchaeota archaeon]